MSKIRCSLYLFIFFLFTLFIGLAGGYTYGTEERCKKLSAEITQAIKGDKNVSVDKFLIVRIRSHKAIFLNELPFNKGEK